MPLLLYYKLIVPRLLDGVKRFWTILLHGRIFVILLVQACGTQASLFRVPVMTSAVTRKEGRKQAMDEIARDLVVKIAELAIIRLLDWLMNKKKFPPETDENKKDS